MNTAPDLTGCLWDELPSRWAGAVGQQIAHIARPVAFTLADGALIVGVDSESWLKELMPMRGEILAKLPATIDGAPLYRITLQIRRRG